MQTLQENMQRDLCLTCLKAKKACFCDKTREVLTRSEFLILIHPKEAKKQKVGTGRMAHIALNNSNLRMGIDFSEDKFVNAKINNPIYQPYLLYPGESSHNIDESPLPTTIERTPLFIIIDGTWACAKTMMRLSRNLHHLPRVSFTNKEETKFSIKQQPLKGCLSTIESIHHLIQSLNHWQQESCPNPDHLLELLDMMVAFQKKCASDPELKRYGRGQYKKPSERNYPKRFEKRSVWFN